ncbi:CDP-diacylglycerol--glycerol-3-phosphate 3-phosphatidyltransferase [Alphaproteobacteria bacterium]|nr:CDP-diacylglycerol--glycerol-3-phosphate 3-phosphatidyltransferase [Alphaproteobacteria bacterium]
MQKNLIKKTIPNSLTIFRCIAGILLPLIIMYGGNKGAVIATPLLLLAGLSDYFDGFYARKYNVVSNFGKIIDPIADKLLVIGALLALASENMLDYNYSFIAALIIILREVFVSGLRESMSSYKITLEVSLLSKWKTTIQLLACGSFLVWRSDILLYEIKLLGLISYAMLWFAAIITAITGIQYILKINLFFKNKKNKRFK